MTISDITDLIKSPLVNIALTITLLMLAHLVIHKFMARIIRRAVTSSHFEKKIDEEKREHTLISIFRTASAVLIWTVGIIIVLHQLDVNLATLATGAGLIGIIVGFGAQSAIKDFLGGIFILAENQYRVDDIVTLQTPGGEISGLVEDITIRITKLRDLDGNLHIIQNGSIFVVTNRSFEYANVNVDVGVDYASDLDKVISTINDVGESMTNDASWSEYIIEPIQFLRVDGFDDSAIRIKSLGKVEPAMQWDVAGEFRRRLIVAFRKHNITIPFPHVLVQQQSASSSRK